MKIKDDAKMKVLVYCWGSMSEPLFCAALESINVPYVRYVRKMQDYHYDAEFAQGLIELLHKEKVDMLFSFDYFPLVAMLCEINKLPYVSWIYDCPQYTLLSKTLSSPYNYIFCFDRLYTERLRQMGAAHCEHYPLAGDENMLKRAESRAEASQMHYNCDISFIGSLYNERRNRYRHVELSDYVSGWTKGLIEAQGLVYGYNFIKDALVTQPDMVQELKEKCQLQLGAEYMQDDLQLVADILGVEVSARERERVLATLSDYHTVQLYTSSTLPKTLQKEGIQIHGHVDYATELPLIYRDSRINLNITSKTIESGIPQRVFDILSCGGFCLTNYQPEIAELFEEGKEIAFYYNMADLVAKAAYYLEHEEERRKIAENGRKKVREYFGLKYRVRGMLDMAKRIEEYGDADNIYKKNKQNGALKQYVNECLETGDVQTVIKILRENRAVVKNDNDLANLYYLAEVCEKEQQRGLTTVYKNSIQATLEAFYELQRKVRRLEWWEEYDPQEVYLYMIEKKLSVYELQWVVETTCVDKAKVWGMLNEK